MDIHWAEICNFLPQIEELSEDDSFFAADLAAAIASKCYYHLQEYNVGNYVPFYCQQQLFPEAIFFLFNRMHCV